MTRVDVPFPAVTAILKEHVNWHRLHTHRGSTGKNKNAFFQKFLIYSSITTIYYELLILQRIHILPYRSSLKSKANQRHKMEKAQMETLKAADVGTSSY